MKKYRREAKGMEGRGDSMFDAPAPFSDARWFQMMWPWICAAALAGVAFELAKFVVSAIRRDIYGRNRNLRYAKKNQRWRRTGSRKGRGNALLPLPPSFAEDVNGQWEKVRDSLEEMLKFGEMLIELDDYVDNSFIYDGDVIVGRMAGMKGFLAEHCPRIGYKTAMRYRMLALKAREVEDKKKLAKMCAKSKTAERLGKAFDSCLKVERRRLEHPRPPHCHCCRESLPSIVSVRSDITRYPAKRKRYIVALRELVREISA